MFLDEGGEAMSNDKGGSVPVVRVIFLAAILMTSAGMANGEELLRRGFSEFLGWRLSETKFRACSGNEIDIRAGMEIRATNERCSFEQRLYENQKRFLEHRVPLILDRYERSSRTVAHSLTDVRVNRTSTAQALPSLSESAVLPSRSQSPPPPDYSAPLLGVSQMTINATKRVSMTLFGDLTRTRLEVFITADREDGRLLRAGFSNLKNAPVGAHLVLWGVLPNHEIARLGQVINTGTRDTARIQTETTLADFGILLTVEYEENLSQPRGKVVGRANP